MASERVEHGKFTYRPLDPERREIRLVELSSESTVGSTGERVPLLLMHHFLPNSGNRPQYRAISYTWGSRPQNIVLIQEEEGSAHEVLVSANLADFLHFAIVNLTSSLYWIDQLSINQEDDAEKSHQVKMMRDIFSQAEFTVVWLGSEGNTTSSETVEAWGQLFNTVVIEREHLGAIRPELDPQALDRIMKQVCENDCEQLVALTRFCTHPWFRRAWVVQEVAVSRNIAVAWEGGSCGWTQLCRIWYLLRSLSRRISISRGHLLIAEVLLEQAISTLEMTVNSSHVLREYNSILEIIYRMISKGQTKATRPEDLVYSVLGIASDSETCGIEIDYSKHYTTVYAEMALLFLKSLGAHALAFSGQLDRGSDPDGCRLPSWVPDLRLKGGFYRYFKLDNPKPRLFSAAGQSSFTYHVDEKFKVLSVRTLKVDSVVEVGKVVNLMVSVDSIFDIHSSLFSAQQTWLKDFAHFLDVAFERYRWSNHDLGWYLDNIELYRKVPFVTKTGYIGLGHENMVVGDEVHLVQGSDTPFILRNTDGRYELVGGTYVHGIMDGELFDDSIRFEEVQLH